MTGSLFSTTIQFEVATLIVAVVSGIAIPVIIFLALRYRSARAALENKKELTEKELNTLVTGTIAEKVGDQTARINKISDDIEVLRERIGNLDRGLLKQLLDCQNNFISRDVYEKDANIQKRYMKIIYGTIKEHAAILEAELGALNGEDED